MKRIRLLMFLLSLIVGGGSVWAQTTLQGVSEITSGQEYYIVNDATGLFMTPGNNWGTRATLDESPAGTATVTLAEGKYTIIFTWPSHGNGLFVDSDDGSTVYCDMNDQGNYFWNITSNGDNTFNLQLTTDQARYKEGSYLTAENSNVWANVQYNSSNENLRKWRFISPSELRAAMPSSVSKMDVSLFIHGSQGTNNVSASYNSFDRFKTRYSWTITGDGWKGQNNQSLTGFSRYWMECWNSNYLTNRSAKKTISNLPAGSYTLSAYTVGGNGVTFYAKVGNGEKLTAATGNGSPILSTINFDIETESEDVELGIESTESSTSTWIAIDNIKLEYVSFIGFRNVYEEALEAASAASESLEGFSVFATQKSTLDESITANTLTGDDLSSKTALQAATTALEAATAAVAAEVAACKNYSSIVSTINGGTNVNLTSFVVNAGFEQGSLTGWTSSNGGGVANNNNFSQKVGTYYVERWTSNGNTQVQLNNGSLSHDAIVLPAGVYEISATGQVQEQKNGTTGGGYFLCANDERAEIGAPARYSTYVKLSDKEELVIKFMLDGCTGNWVSCDDVQLTYVGETFPAVTLVEGKMNATTAATQTSAKETFDANETVANYNALVQAIAAAQTSKDGYAVAAQAITDAKAIQNNFTFVTEEAATTFADAIAAIETPYNENTLANDIAANSGKTLGTVVVGWHGTPTATAVADYMRSAWTDAEHNDWSVEGKTDGSNFLVPFFQNWVADGSNLAAGTTSGQLTNLPNGLYSVSALVRVRIKNEQDAEAVPYGISFKVNDGEAVNACSETQVGETQFYLGTITAEGLVKDGILNAVFTRAEDNNVSWLSFKDITYTKVRDLTKEEQAIAPTAIALFNGETEVTEAITLDIENTTVTLTPSYTPESATEGYINWTSSDESIATVSSLGEVTAVLPGTATITATSTLAPEVSASATINVVFPETEVAEYINDGATRYILGENLIKNGAFEYPNNFYGWTNGEGNALTTDNFNLVTEDENNYVQGKNNAAGNKPNSIRTLWPVEAGKTYVFGYKVKNEKKDDDVTYQKVSLTNNAGEEQKVVSNNSVKTKTSWTSVHHIFTNTENHQYVQFHARWLADPNNAGKISFDDFYLQEVTDIVGNAQYAIDAIPAANIGGGAFQYAPETIMATGINTLVQGTSTPEQVQAVYDNLQAMELNEPTEGQAFNIILTYDKWTYDNKAMTYLANARTGEGDYNIQYAAEPNANYAQAFTFTKVEGNNYKLSQIDEDGNVRYITDQKTGGYGNGTASIRTTTDESKAAAYKIIATSTEGVYNIYNNVANNYIGSQDAGVYTVNSHIDFKIVEAEKANVTGSLAAGKLATRIFPFTPKAIDGIKYYSVEETHLNGNETHIVPVEVEEPVANTPYILYNTTEDQDPIDITQSGFGTATKDVYSAGALTGVYTDSEIAANAGNYILQTQKDVQAFYLVSGSARTATPYRAYLTAPGAGARIAISFDNETTGINGVNAAEKKFDGTVYDLSGRKVAQPARGLYIVNGKKVVIK